MITGAQSSQRILIIEDEENARKGYEVLLCKWGREVVGVANAEEGLSKFGEFQPAVVLAQGGHLPRD